MLAWLNCGGSVTLPGLSHRAAAVQDPQQNYPASRSPALPALNTARRCACALVQVLADIAGHRAQVT
jgi:hypothetical protein